MKKILRRSSCDLVVDAAALHAFVDIAPLKEKRSVVLTPHRGELSKMLDQEVDALSSPQLKKLLQEKAKSWNATIVLKGPEDLIVSPEGTVHINKTGHPIMSKGGTGDVLAGLIGGLMSQGLSGFEAAKTATREWGKVGEYVAKQQGLMVTIKELLAAMKNS